MVVARIQPFSPPIFPNRKIAETLTFPPEARAETKQSKILDGKGDKFQKSLPVQRPAKKEIVYPKRWKEADEQKVYSPPFYIANLKLMSSVDLATRKWIRNASDERAAQEGFYYREQRGQFTVDWVSKFCTLYEGDKGGETILVEDWQYEYFMQVFGWVFWSDTYGREIRRFNKAGVWIPKKNGKSPTLAATGLYLLCGDGEKGAKCYSVARDGKQALIAHTHAMEMVRASEYLSRPGICKVHEATGTITHIPTRSKYFVVSGENKKSTEGFNGNLLVDEIHVTDQKLMDRLKRAGISRSEPLHVEMSTAGDSGDGYGFNRYEYGLTVAKCERDEDYNPRFYFLDFSVPLETPIEKLRDRNFVIDIGRRCNPTLGRILQEDEFVSDWHESTQSQTELRKFAMYRLNLWTKDGANWIDLQDWVDCCKKYVLSQLRDFPCVGGVDLSKTRDLTSVSLMFAVPDKRYGIRPYTWTWHWIPEQTAKRYSAKVDFYRWKQFINICPGKTIDYELVAQRLDWIVENFDCKGFAYDKYYSKRLMDILYLERGWNEEMMTPIGQTMPFLAPATAELERLILRNEIVQNGNPLMKWQFGHCQVKEDGMGNKMPMKPTKDDYRKIDGIASLVNATALFYTNEEIQAGYDDSIILFRKEHLKNRDVDDEE